MPPMTDNGLAISMVTCENISEAILRMFCDMFQRDQ